MALLSIAPPVLLQTRWRAKQGLARHQIGGLARWRGSRRGYAERQPIETSSVTPLGRGRGRPLYHSPICSVRLSPQHHSWRRTRLTRHWTIRVLPAARFRGFCGATHIKGNPCASDRWHGLPAHEPCGNAGGVSIMGWKPMPRRTDSGRSSGQQPAGRWPPNSWEGRYSCRLPRWVVPPARPIVMIAARDARPTLFRRLGSRRAQLTLGGRRLPLNGGLGSARAVGGRPLRHGESGRGERRANRTVVRRAGARQS